MKKIFFIVLVLLIWNELWCDLQDHYKKGVIVLKGVESFGEGNDWEGLFYKPYKDMIVAPNGTIFVANGRLHNVYKFDQKGKFIKKFGRKGRGPSDFFSPGDLTFLDNKYLVVAEYSSNRRFSLWDLNGKYVKVVKTKTSVFYLTALGGNKVAYYYYSRHSQEKNGYQNTISIIIKNIPDGKEKVLKKINLLDRSWIKLERGSVTYENFFGEVYLAQTINGNLAVGISNQPKINIFSPAGELIGSFDLKMSPIPTGKSYINEYKNSALAYLNQRDETTMNASEAYSHKLLKKGLKNYNFSTLFDKFLPLYNELIIDSEGNFLVFKFTECQKDCNPIFQVYSKEGKFICETQLDLGKYELEIDRRFRKIRFTSQGIFALLTEKGDEDETLRLVKSNYSPAP